MTEEELLSIISKGRKPVCKDAVFADQIDPAILKRIDKVFDKGLHYYLDPKSPDISKDASIFFRKSDFESDLNISARKIVNQFEDFKISLSALAKLAELKIERILPKFSITNNPKIVAGDLKNSLSPEFCPVKRDFLKTLISKFAEYNILVFEFVETWNKKERANIDGVFLSPNVIILKRYQNAFRREIFTLIHELGHYLLEEEEVEEIDVYSLASNKLSRVERWCSDFAYYFLIGEYDKLIEEIDQANESNDYHFELLEHISNQTHLSRLSLFTRLLYKQKISKSNYNQVRVDLEEQYKQRQKQVQEAKGLEKPEGGKQTGSAPKPINSPLLVSTLQSAFYEGLINEHEVCRSLNISPNKLEKYLQ
jgi:Zn-dependent peptidase ImmA (M78 family)